MLSGSMFRPLCFLVFAWIAFVVGCDRSVDPAANDRVSPRPRTATTASNEDQKPSRLESLSSIRQFVRGEQWAEAEQAIGAHLVRYPKDTKVMLMAADVYQQQGRLDDAIAVLEAAAEVTPLAGRPWRVRAATIDFQRHRANEAIDRLQALVAEASEDPQVLHDIAALLNARGFRHLANNTIRRLCELGDATAEELRGPMFPDGSFTGIGQKPDVDDQDLIDRLGALNVARAMASEGDVSDAVRVLSASRLVQTNNAAAMAFLGQLLMQSQQYDAFSNWLQTVPDSCRRFPAYWNALGDWAMKQRQFDHATRLYAEAVLMEPGDLASHDRMMRALEAAGNEAMASAFRQRGVLIDRMQNLTRDIFSATGVDPAAVDTLSKMLTDVGRPLEAMAWYRVILTRMGRSDQGEQQLREALVLLKSEESIALQRQQLLCGYAADPDSLDDALLAMRSKNSIERPSPDAPSEFPPRGAPVFVDVAAETGLQFRYRNAANPQPRYFKMYEQTGGGVACLDFDRDGHVDLYVAQAASDPPDGIGNAPNLLARQVDEKFQTVTDPSRSDDRGYTCGVTSGDWNQDGFPDLVIGNLRANTLLINQGDGTFRRHDGNPQWQQPRYTASLAMADVSGDHLPDIVEVNYLDDAKIFDPIEFQPDGTPVGLPAPLHFRACADRIFLSTPQGDLSEVDLAPFDPDSAATGLGILVTDLDGTPGNEIYIANDHLANHLWQQDPAADGTAPSWRNTAAARGVAYGVTGTPLGSMGIAAADFDRNGRLDLHVTNFENEWSNQYMQDASGFFDDLVVAMALEQATYPMVGFGTQAIDFDNNQSADLVIGNGHIDDHAWKGGGFEMPTQVFSNDGSRMELLSVEGDDAYWKRGHLSRAIARLDWNNDGRTDFIATDLQQPLALLENRTQTDYHFVQLQLVGTVSERDAIGARVTVQLDDRRFTHWVQTGDGYMCKNQSLVMIGLGTASEVKTLTIDWPDGRQQSFSHLAADRRWMIIQQQTEPFELSLSE